jgi:hypothetical protein
MSFLAVGRPFVPESAVAIYNRHACSRQPVSTWAYTMAQSNCIRRHGAEARSRVLGTVLDYEGYWSDCKTGGHC